MELIVNNTKDELKKLIKNVVLCYRIGIFNFVHYQVDNDDVKSSALAVVEMMNERITKNGVAAKCAKLELKRVISALLISSKGDEDEDLNAERRFTLAKTLKGKVFG